MPTAGRRRCAPVVSLLLLLLASIPAAAASIPTAAASTALKASGTFHGTAVGLPVLDARAAILIEASTGTVLYELHPDEPIPPASLTKLMTVHLALQAIEEGRLDPSEVLVPGPTAWARNMPPHSSLMFLGPDQRLTVWELLKGLVVDSGNDAAVEVAERLAGSVPAFVALMNREAARLGYRVMHFTEPAGIRADNVITAREYADFARRFIELHPQALKELFSLRQFTYPLPDNLTGGNRQKPVTQTNRNLLLGRYPGVDGLKTGYIDESGYNIAVTARRDGMRLIGVVLGVPGTPEASGEQLRAEESAALLDYGFATFTTVRPPYVVAGSPRVWKGTSRTVGLAASPPVIVVVHKGDASRLLTSVRMARDVEAPVKAGEALGAVVVSLGDERLAQFPLRATSAVERGGWFRRLMDSIVLFLRGIKPLRGTQGV